MMLRDRMRTLMKRRNLTRRELASAFDTSPHTLRGWLDQGKTPPAAIGPLLDLIEKRPQVRAWLGLSRGKKLQAWPTFPAGKLLSRRIARRPQAALAELGSRPEGQRVAKWLSSAQIAASMVISSARVTATSASSPVSPTLEFPGSQGPS